MRRPNLPDTPDDDSREPATEVFAHPPAPDPRRPVRATRPAPERRSGRGGAGSRASAPGPSDFDPFDNAAHTAHATPTERPPRTHDGGSGSGQRGRVPGRRRRVKRIIAWTAGTLAAVLVVIGGYIGYSYFRFVNGVTRVDVISKSGHDVDGPDQNILLVGDDHRPAGATDEDLAKLSTTDDGGGTNTDTMMILHIPADGKSATLISLPRDSWVDVPGHGMNKLNAAFALGDGDDDPTSGAKLLIETVQDLTGLTIDHYVRVSMLGFYTIAEALGPVQVCLNEAVNDPYSGADFPAGVSTLDAKQSLSFVRQRHGLPRGDLDRIVRQQYFLSVEADKFLSAGTLLNPVKLTKVLDSISGSLETDPGLNFLQLALQLRSLTGGKIQSATIPILDTPTIEVDGEDISIVEVDTDAMPEFVQSLMGTPSAYDKATAAKPATTTVTVVNGGDEDGAAGEASRVFADAGFQTGTPGNADSTATTTIRYPAGSEGQAKAVAALLPGASVHETSSVSGVTVVLGEDGIMPTIPGTASDAEPAPAPAPVPSSPATNYSDKVCIN